MKQTRNSIEDIWGDRQPYNGEWPQRVDEYTAETPDKWVQSACLLCSNGCGMDIGVQAPVKLTTLRRYKLTSAGRCKLTTVGRSKLTT